LADFPNPQQDPGMERRLLLVFALTFLVIIAFQPLLKKYFPQAVPPPAKTQSQNPPPGQDQSLGNASAIAPVPVPASSKNPESSATRQAAAESEIVVENDVYRITFTNRGAQVRSWILKTFDDDKGQPLELVNSSASQAYGYPLSLWSYDQTLRNKLNSALYVVSTNDSAGQGQSPDQNNVRTITFEYADKDVSVSKVFKFQLAPASSKSSGEGKDYLVGVQTSVISNGQAVPAFPMWPAGFGDEINMAAYASSQIEYQNNDDTERLAIKKISGGNTLAGPFDWAGVSGQYFAAVFILDDPQSAEMVTLRNPIDAPRDAKKPQETSKTDVLGAAVGVPGGPTRERLYVGPKSLQILESVAVPTVTGTSPDLRSLVSFGYLGVIARPLFIWLRWTYEHVVPNWGWAIVLQTLIISLALLPLRISSMKSMLKMQRIQPQIKAVQEKYKKYSMKDPRKQEMNKEIWAIQKGAGVSPAGGCLPMLIQMPFLFAYYRMLGVALDLRHAHWLWITDLSSRDPYFILPTALVISMIVTQRMTPQAGMDPSQQKMMNLMMPVMMGFFFYNLAAGMSLYYAESNLISIAQQAVMNRTKFGREMREIALKRARKKDK
jgi:YidC/Oxa1 family membrane protein insertase